MITFKLPPNNPNQLNTEIKAFKNEYEKKIKNSFNNNVFQKDISDYNPLISSNILNNHNKFENFTVPSSNNALEVVNNQSNIKLSTNINLYQFNNLDGDFFENKINSINLPKNKSGMFITNNQFELSKTISLECAVDPKADQRTVKYVNDEDKTETRHEDLKNKIKDIDIVNLKLGSCIQNCEDLDNQNINNTFSENLLKNNEECTWIEKDKAKLHNESESISDNYNITSHETGLRENKLIVIKEKIITTVIKTLEEVNNDDIKAQYIKNSNNIIPLKTKEIKEHINPQYSKIS